MNVGPANTPSPSRDRVLSSFQAVGQIWGESGQEKQVADTMVDSFKALDMPGAKLYVDGSGPKANSNTGNVILDIPATPDAPANAPGLALFYHMDRVPARADGVPADEPVKLVVEPDGDIHSAGYRTNIAADDRAGYAEIRGALQLVKDNHIPHGRILVGGLTREEQDSGGACNLDPKLLDGIKYAYSVDADDVAELMRGGCGISSWEANIAGKASHSGVAPKEGISAIQAANDAINHLGPLGAVSDTQTLNVAYINGGDALPDGTPVDNVIPDHCRVAGEFRFITPQDESELKSKVQNAFAQAEKDYGVKIDLKMDREPGFYLADDSPTVKFAESAMARVGVTARKTVVMGGSDAGPLNTQFGLPTALVGDGAQDIHTVKEHININDMLQGTQVMTSLISQTGQPNTP